MFPGEHYILKKHIDAFKRALKEDTAIDVNNPSFSLTIKPHEEGTRPKIISKVGPSFKI